MSSDLAVRAFALSKRYLLGQEASGYTLLTERLAGMRRRQARVERREHWALRDVEFEVERGSCYGIIGHNGAGKSTMLKILSRVTAPTSGGVDLHGRVGALLEVGTGFHSELTGAENVYLNGALLGLRRSEVAKRFDEIVSFAEVEDFIYTPVKRYSSGMYLRLAFAVAAHLEPDILIIDEVLAVGDVAFQDKCLDRMEAVAAEGRTILFVSHNLAAVSRLCDRVMTLIHGRKYNEGPAQQIVDEYVRLTHEVAVPPLDQRTDRAGSGRIRVTDIALSVDGSSRDAVRSGDDLTIALSYETATPAPRTAEFEIRITTLLGDLLLQLDSGDRGDDLGPLPRAGTVHCHIPRLPLPPGTFAVTVETRSGYELLDSVVRATELEVRDGDFYGAGRPLGSSAPRVLTDFRWTGVW